ncbi:hypothetical protein EYF80_063034 [Liparis tanakae]|uniref:Uncharacterized protein n=1 Tax=Liparis tanakae TaxID=230148 RepID=A0A4Z2EDL1_9TELE|nr:hypothetical protein EYF80_063034 [Liparis tanakae]
MPFGKLGTVREDEGQSRSVTLHRTPRLGGFALRNLNVKKHLHLRRKLWLPFLGDIVTSACSVTPPPAARSQNLRIPRFLQRITSRKSADV